LLDKLDDGEIFEENAGKYKINIKKQNNKYVLECSEKDYIKIQKMYNKYERKIYYTNNHLFDTKEIEGKTCINMHDVSDYLGYAKSQYLVNYHAIKTSNFKVMNDGVHADIANFQKLLFGNHLIKPKVKELCKWFNYENVAILVSHRPEVNVLSDIIKYLNEIEIKYELQYECEKYRIDMYIPEYNIAIEVDENEHANRNTEYEMRRENTIREKLKCKFARINPDKHNFSITSEIGKISKMMMVRA